MPLIAAAVSMVCAAERSRRGPPGAEPHAQRLFRRGAHPHRLLVRCVDERHDHEAVRRLRVGAGQADSGQQVRAGQVDEDRHAARFLCRLRSRRVHGRVQQDGRPEGAAQQDRACEARQLERPEHGDAGVRRGPARHERRQGRSDADRPRGQPLGMGRDRQDRGRLLPSGVVHDIPGLRVDLEPEQAEPAPRGRVPRLEARA